MSLKRGTLQHCVLDVAGRSNEFTKAMVYLRRLRVVVAIIR